MTKLAPSLEQVLHQLTAAEDEQQLQLPSGWAQGRALFGGLTVAVVIEHLRRAVAAQQALRSVSVSFVAPAVAGPATVTRTLLRQGKSVTQMRAELIQDGQVVLSALASFGMARPSIIKQSALKHVNLGQPEDGLVMPNIEVVPEFIKHFDMSITIGGLPFSGHRSRSFGGWVRLKQAPLALNEAYVAALVDAWPPALLPHLVSPAPASSLTWTLEFIEPLPQASAADWWQYQADIEYAADGYGHCAARLYDGEGKLVAISRQTVSVFA